MSTPIFPRVYRQKRKEVAAGSQEGQSYAKTWLKPTSGTRIEIILLWHDRVLQVAHFAGTTPVVIGSSSDCDFQINPVLTHVQRWPLLVRQEGQTKVRVLCGIKAQMIGTSGESRELNTQVSGGLFATLSQLETLQIHLTDSHRLIIRHTEGTQEVQSEPYMRRAEAATSALALASLLWGSLFTAPREKAFSHSAQPSEPLPARISFERNKTAPKSTSAAPAQGLSELAAEPMASLSETLQATEPAPRLQATLRAPKSRRASSPSPDTAGIESRKKLFASLLGSGGNTSSLVGEASGRGALSRTQGSAYEGSPQLLDTGGSLSSSTHFKGLGGLGKVSRTGAAGAGKSIGFSKGRLEIPATAKSLQISEGTVDRNAVRKVILANLGAIRTCYNRSLRANSSLSGRIKATWTVDEKGSVRRVSHKSDDQLSATGDCVAGLLHSLAFPVAPAGSEYTVEYPFAFSQQ